MIQLLGAVLIAVCCGWLGEQKARKLAIRVQVLEELLNGLGRMERELELRQMPLSHLMEDLGKEAAPAVRGLFQGCRAALGNLGQERFDTTWMRLVGEIPGLEREDQRTLLPLGTVLGRYSGREQGAAIAGVCRELERRREEARQNSVRLGRVYRTIGAISGGFLIILLL